MIDSDTIARFWDKVDRRGEDDCWEWTAATKRYGYGALGRDGGGSPWCAHRLSWRIHNGDIPEGKNVLHHCDNPPCINPRHLYIGTQSDNLKDAWNRGRRENVNFARGERSGSSVLTRGEVLEIQELLADGLLYHKDIAKRYGVSRQTVTEINRGRTWKHIDDPSKMTADKVVRLERVKE